MRSDVERIYATTELTDAEMIRLMLQREGIDVHLQNQRGSFHATWLPTPATEIDILVDDDDAREAKSILEEYIDGRFKPPQENSDLRREAEKTARFKWFLIIFIWVAPFLLTPLMSRNWTSLIYPLVLYPLLTYLAWVTLSHDEPESRSGVSSGSEAD